MRIFGILVFFVGLLLTITVLGAFIGAPLMLVGGLMAAFGGRRKTVITNVIHVQNSAAPAPPQPAANDTPRPAIKPPEAPAELPSPLSPPLEEEPVEPRSR